MVKWRTRVPAYLRDKADWDEWQSSFAFATIWPRLLAPGNRRRRSQIRTLYYLVLLERLAGVRTKTAVEVRERVVKRIETRLLDLAHTQGIEWYREQIKLDATAGAYIAPILTTGLLVKVMAAHGEWSQSERTVAAATRTIVEDYGGGGVAINGSEEGVVAAWRKWKHAAHLCAALVDYLPFTRTLTLSQAELERIERRDMAMLVVTAIHYQSFLTGESFQFRTRRSFKLANLDSVALKVGSIAKLELPPWDRKPALQRGTAPLAIGQNRSKVR